MLAVVSSHAPIGIDGELVSVEVDIRNGLPGTDLVGLPDGAVRESKERVRVAIRNSGFDYPPDRILVSLAPAGIRKEGASFDLPIALGVLAASGQAESATGAMVLGELNLQGGVRPVRGVLSAVGVGLKAGLTRFLVPVENLREARALGNGSVFGIRSLREAALILSRIALGETPEQRDEKEHGDHDLLSRMSQAVEDRLGTEPADSNRGQEGELSDIRGHSSLKRALEVAAAGGHHLLLFGPPGSGKTMAARRLTSLLPPLDREESLTVTRIHSLAGVLPAGADLLAFAPFRMPHHSASNEGIIGGGRFLKPGEASLAHHGVLFLDEAPEFGMSLLQSLREPVEEGWVSIARAGSTVRFPACFQLVLAFNPCPCGNLGRDSHACLCSSTEIHGYWRRVGGALLDRIDVRIPLSPVPTSEMCLPSRPEEAVEIKARVRNAVRIQRERFVGLGLSRNARIPPGLMDRFCGLDPDCLAALSEAAETLSVSSRAYHSILRIARTIADLEEAPKITREHIVEAIQHRRYGDGDYFWSREKSQGAPRPRKRR